MTTFKQFLAEEHTRSWDGFPWNGYTGEEPRDRDVAPERLPNGDYVMYHGTSNKNANAIIDQKLVKPDDLNCVGFCTTPGAASVYGTMKGGGRRRKTGDGTGSTTLRCVIDKNFLETHCIGGHETGGSGYNQFLFRKARGEAGWKGVPIKSAVRLKRT
jgi:hypothetical protein